MAKPLVIVESPAKARTLARFSGQYRSKASYGHVRDLPESASEVPERDQGEEVGPPGVDTDGDFTPYYVVPDDKRKHVRQLKAAMKDASEVMLATDPDREGESISWHCSRCSSRRCRSGASSSTRSPKKRSTRRSSDAHDVDENLVRAQESRRILDRLYGYTLSPVLWKKVQTGLSAGRVQSVAVRLIVEREEERLAFRDGELLGSRGAGSARRPRVRRHAGARRRRSASPAARTSTDDGVLTGDNVRLLDDGRTPSPGRRR